MLAERAGFVSNLVLWNESGYFNNSADTKPLLHLWSLGIEEQFYIAWPLLLWTSWKRKFNLLAIIGAVAVASFMLNMRGVRTDLVATFYSPLTRIWELSFGSLLAWLTLYKGSACREYRNNLDNTLCKMFHRESQKGDGSNVRDALSACGVLLLAWGLAKVTNKTHFPGSWALLPTLGSVCIISAGPQAWINRRILSNRVLVWFGLISYPLYLWHWPLLSFARIMKSETPSRPVRIAAVVLAIALAWLTYTVVEKPIRNGKNGLVKAIALSVLMALVGFAGYYTFLGEGLGFRFPKIVQDFTEYQYDWKTGYREGSCLLRAEQDYTQFQSCETSIESTKPTIVLWGDSHAAHLYPGYKAVFGESSNIVQRTSSSCPPILGLEIESRVHCKKINDNVFALIRNLKPDKVVLAGVWVAYDEWRQVDKTIAALRDIGIKNIDLIGPVPDWKDELPRQLYHYYKMDIFHRIPYRMNFGLNQNFIALDPEMSDFAAQNNVHYISPKKIMCNTEGCLTRLGETGETITAFDYAHLTEKGSIYLVSKFPE